MIGRVKRIYTWMRDSLFLHFTIVIIWKDSKIPLKHSPSDRVPAAFLALSNLYSCCYNSRNIVYQSEQAWRFIDQSGSSSDLASVCFPAPCTHRMLYALGVSQTSSDPLNVTQRYACWERIQNPSLGRVPLHDKQNWTRCGQKKKLVAMFSYFLQCYCCCC